MEKEILELLQGINKKLEKLEINQTSLISGQVQIRKEIDSKIDSLRNTNKLQHDVLKNKIDNLEVKQEITINQNKILNEKVDKSLNQLNDIEFNQNLLFEKEVKKTESEIKEAKNKTITIKELQEKFRTPIKKAT